jgi:hypothetical protein
MKREMNPTASIVYPLKQLAMRLTVGVMLLLMLLTATGCGTTDKRILSGDEVQALFSDKTVGGYHEKNRYYFISYYEPSGTFRSYQGEEKVQRLGKWWVTGSGDICIRWQEESEDLCRKMETDDNGHYWKVLIKDNGKRIPIVSFESFVDGNVNGL